MFYSISSEQSCVSESASSSDDDSCNSDDDCLILDGDPDKPNAIMLNNCNGSDDLVIISEKGQKKSFWLHSIMLVAVSHQPQHIWHPQKDFCTPLLLLATSHQH